MEYLNITEASKRVGLSRKTLSLSVKAGKWETVTFNKRIMLLWKDGCLVKSAVQQSS